MLHHLTIGHLDPAAVERRQTVPTRALEMDVVDRLLGRVGGEGCRRQRNSRRMQGCVPKRFGFVPVEEW